MSDLISRTGAIAHFDKVAEELDEQRGDDSWVGNAFKICLLGVVNDLAVLPSADAVEVVRCKDCKHSHMTYGGECKYCDMWKEDGEALYLDGDFFCAYGERKEP